MLFSTSNLIIALFLFSRKRQKLWKKA